ncbi:hypothetical protein KX530_29595, partial [Escherichia coli]|nr:hypothetical protein [Escherichia coli]MCD4164219.1 hypothetical protein [Escherichia coli]MCD4237004.1 hypothetical protein [Escherichia coli]
MTELEMHLLNALEQL